MGKAVKERVYFELTCHIPRRRYLAFVVRGIVVGQTTPGFERFLRAYLTGVGDVQVSFNMPPQVLLCRHDLSTSETPELDTAALKMLCHHRVQAGIEVWEGS